MPLCGFNKEMLEGLKSFHEGLVENKSHEEFKSNQEHGEDN